MKFLPDCYACAMRQALSAARLVSDEEGFHHECLLETARILSQADLDAAPPVVGEQFYRAIRELSGSSDPFREQKRRQNDAVLSLLPWLRETVARAPDPLLMAVRLAIAGNAVDPGAQESFDLEKSVIEAVSEEAELEDYPYLREALESARNVLLIADNCGEIVFDMVLLETILAAGEPELMVAVRGGPIINDVTGTEAREVGLDRLATVISSGMEMPGTVVSRSTSRFREAFEAADTVISKGQGNWETLEDCDRDVFFLFQAKCRAVAAVNDCEEGRALLVAKRRGG